MRKDSKETVAVKLLWVANLHDPLTITHSAPLATPLRKQMGLVRSWLIQVPVPLPGINPMCLGMLSQILCCMLQPANINNNFKFELLKR